MAKVSTPLNGGQRVGRAYMGGHSMNGPSTPPVAHVGTTKKTAGVMVAGIRHSLAVVRGAK